MSDMMSYIAAPAASRRLRPTSLRSTSIFTGSRIVTLIFGNQRRRTCASVRREKMVFSGPSMRTGTTIASDLSAIMAAPS